GVEVVAVHRWSAVRLERGHMLETAGAHELDGEVGRPPNVRFMGGLCGDRRDAQPFEQRRDDAVALGVDVGREEQFIGGSHGVLDTTLRAVDTGLVEDLRTALSPDRVRVNALELDLYARDASVISGRAEVVCFPLTTEE